LILRIGDYAQPVCLAAQADFHVAAWKAQNARDDRVTSFMNGGRP
jgi:hypothetical protein